MRTVELSDETCRLIEKVNGLYAVARELRETYRRTPQSVVVETVRAQIARDKEQGRPFSPNRLAQLNATEQLLEETPERQRFSAAFREATEASWKLNDALRAACGAETSESLR
jgi:hypothetical protein